MQPKIEITSFEGEGSDLEYTMAVELLPEIKTMDFAKLKLEKLVVEPSAKEIDEALERIAEGNKVGEPIKTKRAAKKGDVILINFDGSVDGEKKEGMQADDYELELGSNSFIDTFEDQLVGTKPGEHVSVTVTFPEQYHAAELAGKEAVFEVDIKEIREMKTPKIDKAFAERLGFGSMDELKEAVSKQISGELGQVARQRLKRTLLDDLNKHHDFDVPPGMVDMEFDAIWKQAEQAQQQMHDHVHDENCDHDHDHDDQNVLGEEDKAEYREIAERRVRLGLVLSEVARQNKLEISQEELQRAVIQEAQRYPGQERVVFDYYKNNPQAVESLRAPLFEDKAIDYILELADVTERKISPEDLIAEENAEEEAAQKKAKKPAKKTAKKAASSKKATGSKAKTTAKKATEKKPAKKAASGGKK